MKVFLTYLDLGYDGVILNKETRCYYNMNSANSYRWRKQKTTIYGRWKIKRVLLK